MLDRYLYDFEAVGDDTGGGAAPAADVGAADPGDGAGGGEAAWSGPDQETWESTQQQLAEQREAIEYFASLAQPQNPFQGQQQQPEQVQIDPLDDNFQSQLDSYIDQKFAGYQQYVEAQQFREGEARAQDIIADDIAKNGDFVFDESKEQARLLANNYIAQTNQQYPNDPARAAEAALTMAAQAVRNWETEVGKRYHEKQINQLGTLSGARPELGAQGVNGSSQFTVPAGGGLLDVVARHVGGNGN